MFGNIRTQETGVSVRYQEKRMDSERWLRSYQLLQEYEPGNALDVHRRLRSRQASQRADR